MFDVGIAPHEDGKAIKPKADLSASTSRAVSNFVLKIFCKRFRKDKKDLSGKVEKIIKNFHKKRKRKRVMNRFN
ncbi:MAG: hypothetical protein R3B55_01945 [Candidatus Paceibacterota bacterium]